MRLNDPLVTTFLYEGKEYSINLAFDNVLDVFDYLDDKTLRDHEKAEICLALLLGDQTHEPTIDMWNHVYESFIHIESKQPIEYDRKGNPMPVIEEDTEPFYDLEQDAEYIFSSFQQAYGMNLYEQQGKLHWYQFRALLNALPSDTMLQRIIQIRLWQPSKHESTEYKTNMKKLQKLYALQEKEVD